MVTGNTFAEQQQYARDLRSQLSEIGQDDTNENEMQFIEWSPGRKMVRLWSMQDGTEITIPRYMVASAISKRLPDGRFAFTAHKEEAPAFKEGTERCFLAEDSVERLGGLLEAAGLDNMPPCPAKHLRSRNSKRVHAQHRHRQSWETLQEYIQTEEAARDREERRKEVEAIQQLANVREKAQKGT